MNYSKRIIHELVNLASDPCHISSSSPIIVSSQGAYVRELCRIIRYIHLCLTTAEIGLDLGRYRYTIHSESCYINETSDSTQTVGITPYRGRVG